MSPAAPNDAQPAVLAEILQLDPIYVVANLSEQDLMKVRANLGQRRWSFVLIRLPDALLVPDRAVQADQGGRYLLVLNQDDVVEQRYVELGQLNGICASSSPA